MELSWQPSQTACNVAQTNFNTFRKRYYLKEFTLQLCSSKQAQFVMVPCETISINYLTKFVHCFDVNGCHSNWRAILRIPHVLSFNAYISKMNLVTPHFYFRKLIGGEVETVKIRKCSGFRATFTIGKLKVTLNLLWRILLTFQFLLSNAADRSPIIRNLSMRVFETRTATGREHFVFQDSGVSQIFILIISYGEKILRNVNVVVWRQVKRENSFSGCRTRLKNART